jgi:serine/threonine protein kinase
MADSPPLSINVLRRIESVCTRFEQGVTPEDRDIGALLAAASDEERLSLLRELAALDVEMRRQRGEKPLTSDYLCHIDSADDQACVVAAIHGLVEDDQGDNDAAPRSTRYEFLEQVGSGGVSTVWRVFDSHGRRSLAIKLLHERFRNDVNAQVRMQREALLTGSLQHPGIPPVYDHGCLDDGSVFLTMKLVQGETLESILKSRDAATEDLGHCLGIFEQVSQTLAYAHSQGIIHRDLKPQNMMVGRFGEVQVMDWGMAKRLGDDTDAPAALTSDSAASPSGNDVSQHAGDDTTRSSTDSSWHDARHSLTSAGDVLGTPCYMPPEQARGEIESLDRRSDVFGLGAILFEILTHQRLYRGGNAGQVLTQAAAGDLSQAMKILQAASVDEGLRDLCMRCLSADRADRPSDAAQVADHIAQHLASAEDRLKQAEIQRREAVIRAAEEAKRRRTLSLMSVAVATISILGIAGVAWQWRQAIEANSKATVALALADERFQQAKTVVDEYLTEVAQSDGVLAAAPGTESLRRSLLEKAREYYEQFLSESGNNPTVRYEAAQAYARLGQITLILDPASEDTFRLYGKAIELFGELIEDNSDRPEYRMGVADARGAIGNAHFAASRFDQAVESYAAAADVWVELIAKRDDPKDVLGLAKATHNMGHAKSQMGDKQGAEPFLVEAIALAEPLLESNGEVPEYLFEISNMYSNAGTFFGFKMGDWKRSLELYETSVALRERLVQLAPDHHRNQNALAGGYNNVGLALYQAKRIDEAKGAFETAAEIREVLTAENPAIPQYAKELGDTYTNLGTFSAKQGRPDEAVNYYDKSVTTFVRLADAHPQIIIYPQHAIDALQSIASCDPSAPRAIESIKKMTELYARLIELKPQSRSYARLMALYLALLPDQPPEPLLALTERFSLPNEASPAELTVRALALYRSGDFSHAADHMQAIPRKQYNERTWAVASLVQAQVDPEGAKATLQQARKIIRKRQFPDYEDAMLLAEAEALVNNKGD